MKKYRSNNVAPVYGAPAPLYPSHCLVYCLNAQSRQSNRSRENGYSRARFFSRLHRMRSPRAVNAHRAFGKHDHSLVIAASPHAVIRIRREVRYIPHCTTENVTRV